MSREQIHVVTGAFGYSGKYIAKRLLDKGYGGRNPDGGRNPVRTLTNSTARQNPFGDQIEVHPFNFDDTARLVKSLEGATVLYNTYWVRFNHALFTHATAVENTLKLFAAAKEAGVERIVHVSITNPSKDSPLEYFRDKARLEEALIASGISYAILRPTVLFGKEDILINNIAWMLRKFPVFGVFGDGSYQLQPIYVDDLARIAVEQGEQRDSVIIDATGPETFTYRELVETVGRIIGKKRVFVSVSPAVGLWVGRLVGRLVNDVLVTREEIDGLMAGLLYVDSPPAGETKLTEWAKLRAPSLGRRYTSELARRRNRRKAYQVN
jgi:NADH dehydrogenase